MLGWYVAAVAEKNGIPPDAVPPKFAEAVRTAVLKVEANSARLAAVENALHLAARGDFEKSGRVFREHMLDGARSLANARLVERLGTEVERIRPDANLGKKVRSGSKRSRKDALRMLMEKAYAALLANDQKPTWREVLAALPAHDAQDEFKTSSRGPFRK